jgi:hypothetical protein
MNTMNFKPIINNLLVPIEFNETHLNIAIQAAEIAKKHQADLYLLHVETPSIKNYFKHIIQYKKSKIDYKNEEKRVNLLHTWKRWIEKEYGIKVHIAIDWGNWNKVVLTFAKKINTSLVALPNYEKKHWRDFFSSSKNEYIIKNNPCQVITFISKKNSISQWKNIIIPVTNFIPEKRIKTIIELVKSYNIKLHLIAFSSNTIVSHKSNFYYLTETLKILKASGNIQVECKCINLKSSQLFSIFKYAKEINADAVITNNNSSFTTFKETTLSMQSYFNTSNENQLPKELVLV